MSFTGKLAVVTGAGQASIAARLSLLRFMKVSADAMRNWSHDWLRGPNRRSPCSRERGWAAWTLRASASAIS
jgi:hypothetical protein